MHSALTVGKVSPRAVGKVSPHGAPLQRARHHGSLVLQGHSQAQGASSTAAFFMYTTYAVCAAPLHPAPVPPRRPQRLCRCMVHVYACMQPHDVEQRGLLGCADELAEEKRKGRPRRRSGDTCTAFAHALRRRRHQSGCHGSAGSARRCSTSMLQRFAVLTQGEGCTRLAA